jgi:8-oxo-dGTP pyrophosphatase MutT (NUDIX family)
VVGEELGRAMAQVEAFVPVDPVQARHRATILAFCAGHPDALLRDPGGHLTASALVVAADGERLLVLWHKKLRKWLQPGGHADGVADLAAGARREATEETGITGLEVVTPAVDVDVHRVTPPGEPPHLHLDVRFIVLAPAGAEPVANVEADRFRWVTPAELPGLGADESLLRLARLAVPVGRRTLLG